MRNRQIGTKTFLVALLSAVLALCTAGCVTVTPTRQGTAAPVTVPPEPLQTPSVTRSAAPFTPVPTVRADELRAVPLALGEPLLADLNGDGREDSIVLMPATSDDGYRDTVELSFRFGEKEQTVQVSEGYLISAFAFTGGWGNCGILVSVDLASDDYYTVGYRFDGGMPVLSCEEYGCVDEVDGNRITIGGVVDVIGTHLASREYELNSNFELSPAGDGLWHLEEGEGVLIVSRELPVELIESGKPVAATLEPGTALTLTATDAGTFALFTLSDGREGRLEFTFSEWATTLIDGVEDYEWFESVQYYG
ncbi:MAG: hypothetical protein AAGU74_10680 [Bacillota bacterium]